MRVIPLLAAVLMLTAGCASHHYAGVETGELRGKLLVQWIDYDTFVFLPDETAPLTFIRHNQQRLTPGKMYTDGGTIPRPLWALKSYSPWGYAPAFIIHDWLFVMQHCKLPGYEQYDVHQAAGILSEIMKTLMEDPRHGGRNQLVLYSMHEAVRSPIAQRSWREGACTLPLLEDLLAERKKPLFEYVIEFP